MRKHLSLFIILNIICLIFTPLVQAKETKIEYPIVILDTCRVLHIDEIEFIFSHIDIKYDWMGIRVPSVEQLSLGTGLPGFDTSKSYLYTFKSDVSNGTPYNTIIFIIGVTYMSTGWSKGEVDISLKKIQSIIEWAKENKIKIVGMHIDGKPYRSGKVGGKGDTLNEDVIDAIAPQCDVLIVQSSPGDNDGNFDGKFTKIAKEHDIDLYTPETLSDCLKTLKSLIEE